MAEAAAHVDRSRLPTPGPSKAITFPAIERSTLSNGMGVWTVHHDEVPVVALSVLARSGASSDPSGQWGLAALTADMLDEGSGSRSAIEMHEAIAGLGAHLETDIGSDALAVGFTVLARFAEPALGLLGDVLARPALRDGDFARVRQLRLHRLAQLRDVPGAIADRAFVRAVYGREHPYGHIPVGDEVSLSGMTADDVRRFHAQAIRPDVATLVAVGDCDHATIRRFAELAFAGWTTPGRARADAGGAAAPQAAPAAGAVRLSVVPRPGAAQSELRIGHVAATRRTPDYHALVTANTVLGGQFTSRINLKLRQEKGVTYGARTSFDFRRGPGPFLLQAGVQTSATVESIEDSLKEIADLGGPRPVTAEELRLATAALTRGYARNFETADQIARAVMQLALYELPDTYFSEFVPRVERLTVAEITDAFVRHVDPSRLAVVIVGDLDEVGPDLPRLKLGDPLVLSAD